MVKDKENKNVCCIELSSDLSIIQAKEYHNQRVSSEATFEIIKAWAEKHDIYYEKCYDLSNFIAPSHSSDAPVRGIIMDQDLHF